jgi:hypothetical protein
MKKVKVCIDDFWFRSANHYYGVILFDSIKLDSPELSTKNYKTKSGALKAAIKICERYGLDYEVIT